MNKKEPPLNRYSSTCCTLLLFHNFVSLKKPENSKIQQTLKVRLDRMSVSLLSNSNISQTGAHWTMSVNGLRLFIYLFIYFVLFCFVLFETLIFLRTVPWICREANLSDHNNPLEAKTNRNGTHHVEIPEKKKKKENTES